MVQITYYSNVYQVTIFSMILRLHIDVPVIIFTQLFYGTERKISSLIYNLEVIQAIQIMKWLVCRQNVGMVQFTALTIISQVSYVDCVGLFWYHTMRKEYPAQNTVDLNVTLLNFHGFLTMVALRDDYIDW